MFDRSRFPHQRVTMPWAVRKICRQTNWLTDIGLYRPNIIASVCDLYTLYELPSPSEISIIRTAYSVQKEDGVARASRRSRRH